MSIDASAPESPPRADGVQSAAAQGDERQAHYRDDIDGLRAIAVLAVVVFHLGFTERITGGFVGVDVFFVISGYLITGIVRAELDAGRFSVVGFYNRRVRRIFPALFVVYLFCSAASVGLLFPTEVKSVVREILSSIAFVSNIAFARADGYFDESSRTSPLLHTWSLSVEEQFYVVLPLLLLALSRVRPMLRSVVLAVLTVASFAACVKVVGLDRRDAFYLVHFRAWELLMGSLLALGVLPPLRHRVLAELLGVVGLLLIFFAIVRIDGTLRFPGYWALPPCLGALAILYSGGSVRTLTARLLGSLPLRVVGLISYSLYLWHWPLIAFYNTRHDHMTGTHRWLILAVTCLVSALSYRYVERPFRRKPYAVGARGTLLIAGASMASAAAIALAAPKATALLRPRAALADAALSYQVNNEDMRPGTCFLNSGYDDFALFRKDICLKIDPTRRNFLVLGDSHAANFVPAFAALHKEINVLQATASGCQAIRHGTGTRRCTQLFSYIFDEYLPSVRLDAVVLAGHWPAGTASSLLATVSYLREHDFRVIVLGPVVQYAQPFPHLLARSILEDQPDLPAQYLRPGPRAVDRRLAARLRKDKVEYFSVYNATCPKGVCTQWAAPGVPMQFDISHLTPPGAELVLQRLGPGLFR